MKKNYLSKGVLTENFKEIGKVTPAMLHERACELAVIADRTEPTNSDYAQAQRELTGESEMDPHEESLESIPESERWNPVPGSEGHQIPNTPNADEDDEGHSLSEQLYDQGVSEAAHDQMLKAAEENLENNRG